MPKNSRFLIGLVAVAGVVTYLVWTGITQTSQYYLTPTGQHVVLTALKLRELVVIPALAGLLPSPP